MIFLEQEACYAPTIEDLKTIAESGVYRRIPVAREIYSDCFTLYRSNENAEGTAATAIFESAEIIRNGDAILSSAALPGTDLQKTVFFASAVEMRTR